MSETNEREFTPPARIDLEAFAAGTACLTPAVCAELAEAAASCLTVHGHTPGVPLDIEGAKVGILWSELDARAAASHADPQDATEDGAVGVAIELVRQGSALDVVRRSRKGTGFDWHLGTTKTGPPFAGTACLEVSGVFNETRTGLSDRMRIKLAQVERGGLGLPGFVVVVGFAVPSALVRRLP